MTKKNEDLNHVTLRGTLGRNPEFRFFSDGTEICTISIYTKSGEFVNKETGETRRDYRYHRAVARKPEFVDLLRDLAQGDRIEFVGNLLTRSYRDKNGEKRYSTEVVINRSLKVISRKDSDEAK